jgi:hypothetical protein
VTATLTLPQLPVVLLDDAGFLAHLPRTLAPWVASAAGVDATAVTVQPPYLDGTSSDRRMRSGVWFGEWVGFTTGLASRHVESRPQGGRKIRS